MFDVLQPDHPERKQAIDFVSHVFKRAYGANVEHFLPYMMRVRNKHLQYRSVLGYRDAASGPLYLEYYLDEPIEQAISSYLGYPVDRSKIVEVGNLAEAEAGDARMAIIGATAYFYAAGYRWVAFTGVRRLRNAFSKLGLSPKQLIAADERRLPAGDIEQWGTYYKGDPVVCFGSLEDGHNNLQDLWESLRDTWAAAEHVGLHMASNKQA
ncbi:MAG: thermostable hemolysin [Mariprofundus sp.]|nr:thermostable hemolysin [Mariprofundus sp.]